MMKKNNFKILEDQELQNLEFDSDRVQNNIDTTVGVYRFFTDIIELYLPKVVDTMVNLITPNQSEKK